MSSQEDLQRRFSDLEERLAHFERASDDLSSVVIKQSKAIEKMERRLAVLTDRLLDMQQDQQHAPSDDRPPPHY